MVDIALLEAIVREHLNRTAPRVMGVLRPLKLVIDNYPDNQVEEMDAVNNPEDLAAGTRKLPFSKVLYIDQDDFREIPPPKYYRLSPGVEVRLRYAYFVTATHAVKNERGDITEVHCTYDPATRGGDSPDGRRVKATIHWVSAVHAMPAEVRLYDRLFTRLNPDDTEEDENFMDYLNHDSLEVIGKAMVEPGLAQAAPGSRWQFERVGYFIADTFEHQPQRLIFNRTVGLRDTWAKIEEAQKGAR
jgi:glutaminyl-tRNA synthetase